MSLSLQCVCVSWCVTTCCDNQLITGSARSRSRQTDRQTHIQEEEDTMSVVLLVPLAAADGPVAEKQGDNYYGLLTVHFLF